ncbi:MAG: hypothetical protein B6U85_01015 [Desulfurococcales archaeon ex4484_42]|nr:MAG: hypothetical protein B6U85_01015 [Desulfurococcales archaeon ex4484_42]
MWYSEIVLKIISWVSKDISGSRQDTIQALYEIINNDPHISESKTLLLIGKSLGNIANTNFRSILEGLLNKDIIIVHDIVDAIKLTNPLINLGFDPLTITYIVPSKHISMVNVSSNCREKCLEIEYLDILRENEFFMIDSKADLRAYYDFLSDVWIKKLKSKIKSCSNINVSNEVCIAGYSPIPKVMIKVASNLGLNSESIKSLMSILKVNVEDPIVHAFKTLEQVVNKCKNVLFMFLSPYMDSGMVAFIIKR